MTSGVVSQGTQRRHRDWPSDLTIDQVQLLDGYLCQFEQIQQATMLLCFQHLRATLS